MRYEIAIDWELLHALASDVDHARRDLGVTKYDPKSQICGVHDGRINITGIGWLLGDYYEPDEETEDGYWVACKYWVYK